MSLPIVLYASCVKRVPMVVMGLLQYLSPTFGIVCSIILHEKGARAIHHLLLHLGGTASVYRRDDVPGAAGKAGRNTDGCRSRQ